MCFTYFVGLSMSEGEVLKVTLVEGQKQRTAELQQLEQFAAQLVDVEKLLDDCKVKLSDAERELADYRQKSELERRFSELVGIPYIDKSHELEENVKSLKEQLENLSSEKAKIRGEILSCLANVVMPLEIDGRGETSDEIFFKFRDGLKFPAITAFIKKELKFGLPPVYVTLAPEGLKVVGVNDKISAVKEVIKAVEGLRVKAAGELTQYPSESFGSQSATAQGDILAKNILSPFKKFGKH
ncbi:MAG: hypothetical protein QW717_03085 [Candidatus Bathyarchaeia archaeon]